MGALTEVYVDPSIAANTGSGTIGSPYGDLQYALNTVTRDSTNGNRINIKAGTAEILTATLDFTTYGTPTAAAPLVFQGYTSAAGDAGKGDIDGNNGNFNIFNGGRSHVRFIDLHVHNTGTASVIKLGATGCGVLQCEVDTTTLDGIENNTSDAFIIANNIYGFGRAGAALGKGIIADNFIIISHSTGGSGAINLNPAAITDVSVIERNIIYLTADNNGINLAAGSLALVRHNSIYCSVASTRRAIFDQGGAVILGNIMEGFSGVGGAGVDNIGAAAAMRLLGFNSAYNCETPFDVSEVDTNLGSNETLSASPFAKSGSPTFANRFSYFAPVDVGVVQGGAYVGA